MIHSKRGLSHATIEHPFGDVRTAVEQTKKNKKKATAKPARRAAAKKNGARTRAVVPQSPGLPVILNLNAPSPNTVFGLAAFEYIERIQTVCEPAPIQDAFVAAISALGITNFALLEITPDPDTFGRGVIGDTMPDGWKQRYFEQRYAETDPCVIEIMTNPEPFLWSEALGKSSADKLQRRIFHEATEFCLNEGMCIPIYGPRRYMAFATLAGMHLDLTPASRAAFHVMALYTHNRLMKLAQAGQCPLPGLTRREANCLQWVAQGKTDWEIGEILNISERTAHWYIESAKRKLGVATRVQAVVRAVVSGLIAI